MLLALIILRSEKYKKQYVQEQSNVNVGVYLGAREQWCSNTRSSSASDKTQAALKLVQMRDFESINDLRNILQKDSDTNVRAVCALALGILKDRESIDLIISATRRSADPLDVTIALEALSKIGDISGAPFAIDQLDSAEEVIRLKAVATLESMHAGDRYGEAILLKAKRNSDPGKEKTYAMALGKLNIAIAEEYLINLAKRRYSSPSLGAIYLALGRIRSEAAVELLVKALSMEEKKSRENAKIALISISSPDSAPFLWGLLKHHDSEVRFSASEVLALVDHPHTDRVLSQLLEFPLAAGAASQALGKRKVVSSVEKIAQKLNRQEQPERYVLAVSLGEIGDLRAVSTLISVLNESSGDARIGAARGLGMLKAERAIPDLEKAAKSNDFLLVKAAIEALTEMANPAGAEFFESLIMNRVPIAFLAWDGLVFMQTDQADGVLYRLLEEKDPDIRSAAANAISKRKHVDSARYLKRSLSVEENINAEKAIRKALNAVEKNEVRRF